MQSPLACSLCKHTAQHPIMLICSHYLCFSCGQNIQIMESTSLIQNKYRIQCPKCRRLTHTYEIQNLLLEAMQLNLITDSTDLDKEQLHELCHQKNQQEAILARRVSHVYCMPTDDISKHFMKNNATATKEFDINNFALTPTHNPMNSSNNPSTATNNSFQRNNKLNSGSERVSPAKQNTHQKKQSFPNYYLNEENRESSKAMLNTSQNQKNNLKVITAMSGHNTPSAQQPFSTPLSSNYHFAKENNVFNQPSDKSNKMKNCTNYQNQQQQNLNQQQNFNYTIQNQNSKILEKENDVHQKPNSSSNIRHKRSQTGIPKANPLANAPCTQINQNQQNLVHQQNQQHQSSSPQIQIVSSYFKMVQKNLQLLEKDLVSNLGNKSFDASFIYGRLKKISNQMEGPEDELIQQIKVILQLKQEISNVNNQANTCHRKTSSNLIYQSDTNSNSNTSFTNNTSMLQQLNDKTEHKIASKLLDTSINQERYQQKSYF